MDDLRRAFCDMAKEAVQETVLNTAEDGTAFPGAAEGGGGMSVLIRGMELDGRPHKAFLTERDGKSVLVVETQYSYADNEVKVYPVEGLPPHGRLIDADAFREEMDKHYPFDKLTQSKHGEADAAKGTILLMLAEAPTIIPASEEVDNG